MKNPNIELEYKWGVTLYEHIIEDLTGNQGKKKEAFKLNHKVNYINYIYTYNIQHD